MGMSSDYHEAISCNSNMLRLGTVIFGNEHKMENEISLGLLLNLKTILIYLILILFLIDLAKADSYNKIARIIKILLFPLLIIFNIHYKKINVGLLFAALLVNGITFL